MKLNKRAINDLRRLSQLMPVEYTTPGQKTYFSITGHNLIFHKVEKVEGKDTEADKRYVITQPGGVKVNHFKRMLRLAESKQYDELERYINTHLPKERNTASQTNDRPLGNTITPLEET
jgi:hypothetical protein